MLDHSDAWSGAFDGSVQPVVQVDAWYDGELVTDTTGNLVGRALPVVSGSVSFDSTALVQSSGTVTLAGDDDTIIPTDFDSMLACGGSVLHIQQGIRLPGGGVELMDLGWLRIDSSNSQESWQTYPDSSVQPRGVQVACQVSDVMAVIDEDGFVAAEQPPPGASVLSEIVRLAAHSGVQVADLSAWTDQAVPPSLTYGDSRSTAITSLAGVIAATARAGRHGALELVPSTPPPNPPPSWEIDLGQSGPPLISFARQFDRAGLYNAVKSTGTDAAGNQIIGYATEDTGPLRYGGPFGCLVYQHDSPLITTRGQAMADAQTSLDWLIAQRAIVVPLTIPANTALETLDVLAVELPWDRKLETTVTVTGWIQSINLTLGAGSMQVGLAVPYAQLAQLP